ncbi:MAG: DUF3578 domain-containing protein [Methylococcaceae bacterium]|jgi:MrcB-like, N-terminal domain
MLRDILKRILTEWPNATQQPFTDHPIAVAIRKELSDKISSIISEIYPSFLISGSAGAGNWANVPWLSILNPEITKTTQDGIYPCYLFRADGSGVYLSVIQGTTAPQKLYGKAKAENLANLLLTKIRSEMPLLVEWGMPQVDLRASTPLGKSYEKSTIAARFYPLDSLPSEDDLRADLLTVMKFYEEIEQIWRITRNENILNALSAVGTKLPKPFLLLAGISGTGKTRFVREQAAQHSNGDHLSNYCLIPVRPDWHEPSDLLGYISRIGQNGSRYVVTDLLCFIVKVWQNAWASATAEELVCKAPAEMTPYWLCLDEMNLAPVEQYFADYLSILETRKWQDGSYSCDPLLKSATIEQLDSAGQQVFRKDLNLDDEKFDDLWLHFLNVGIPLPPNLIVAGTVNMDETTHGFSRKVIDRAFTIDFGVFYPNDFDHYLDTSLSPRHKKLGFPVLSKVTKDDLTNVNADKDGAKSIAFLKAINDELKGTPFELAYRALNELLLAVVSFNPKDDAELQAVWDDFLMSKVLPRIDGDADKLKSMGDDSKLQANSDDSSLLIQLLAVIKLQFSVIWSKKRPDLLRENIDGSDCTVYCRSKQKLEWMQKRLADNGFTTFWP